MTTVKEHCMHPTAPPLSETERAVAELWKEVLIGTETLTATDNFFALGGDSMAMVTVLFRIQEEFSVELSPAAIFNAPSLGELAALVDATSDHFHSSQIPPERTSPE